MRLLVTVLLFFTLEGLYDIVPVISSAGLHSPPSSASPASVLGLNTLEPKQTLGISEQPHHT